MCRFDAMPTLVRIDWCRLLNRFSRDINLLDSQVRPAVAHHALSGSAPKSERP